MNINSTTTAIFDIMSEGVVIIDIHACIVYANKAYCNFLKLKPEEIQGRALRDIRP